MKWHRLSSYRVDGDPDPTEVTAACMVDGVAVLATWSRKDDGTWRVFAADTEMGAEVTVFDDEEPVPPEPPAEMLTAMSDEERLRERVTLLEGLLKQALPAVVHLHNGWISCCTISRERARELERPFEEALGLQPGEAERFAARKSEER